MSQSQPNKSWSDVVKERSKSRPDQGRDHQPSHATAQSRDPPSWTPSPLSASLSNSGRKLAQGHGDPVSHVLERDSVSTVRSGTDQPTLESDSPAAFPSLQSANPHHPQDVDPVLASLVDDTIAREATHDVPVEITKAAGSADIKQGATAANTLAAATESALRSTANVLPQAAAVKQTGLGRALDRIEPRDEESRHVTSEEPELVPLTQTSRGGKAVELEVIELTQQDIPFRTSTAPHEKSVIDEATGGFVPGTQEAIEPESHATSTGQPEFVHTSHKETSGENKCTSPSDVEKSTGGYIAGAQERNLHASGTRPPPPTPISQLDASPTWVDEHGAEAQAPLLLKTLAKSQLGTDHQHANRQPERVPISLPVQHTEHAAAHAGHTVEQAVPTSTQEIKEIVMQGIDKVRDVMPSGESVPVALSTVSSSLAYRAAESTKSAEDQASVILSDKVSQAKGVLDWAYDGATSTASSAADSLKSALLPSSRTESLRAEPLSHTERAEALLDQIQDVAAIGPDAVRATLASGSSSSVEPRSVGGSTGSSPSQEHAIEAASHGHKMSPEEAAEARADDLFSKFGGGSSVHKKASEPPSATVSVSGGGNMARRVAQRVESTPTSANRAEHILATYESAARLGPDAVRATLAAGVTDCPHKERQHLHRDVPPAVTQRILEQARASIDQLTAGGHNEVELVASDSSPASAMWSPLDTTIGEGLDYAASFARGVRAGMTQAARNVEKDVYETTRKSEGELAIPMSAEHERPSQASETVHHRAEEAREALAPVVAEGTVETIVHAAEDVVSKVETSLLSIAESVGLYHGTEE